MCYAVNFLGVSGDSVSLRYQLVCCYNVSKTSVSYRYQFWRLCDVLTWSVSLRYQLIGQFDVSNWSVLFTQQRDVTSLTYHLLRSDDVLAWSATSWTIWDLNETSLQRCMSSGSRVLQKLLNYFFNGTAILTSFLLPLAEIFL